jgi:hypothetical protein
MTDCLHKNTHQTPQGARGGLTNGPACYSLMTVQNTKANRAECWNTPHGSDPTLTVPVTGLRSIITNHKTPVLCGFGGPTDSIVGLGRFAVLGSGRV